MDERQIEKTEAPKAPCNLPGDRIKVNFRWKNGKRGSELEKVGETDLQKQVNEAARGMTCGEQIARILRGDYSGIQPGEGVTGDITGFADKTSGEVLHATIKPLQEATRVAMDNNLTLSELEKKLTEIQNEINGQKKAQGKALEKGDAKTEVKENA